MPVSWRDDTSAKVRPLDRMEGGPETSLRRLACLDSERAAWGREGGRGGLSCAGLQMRHPRRAAGREHTAGQPAAGAACCAPGSTAAPPHRRTCAAFGQHAVQHGIQILAAAPRCGVTRRPWLAQQLGAATGQVRAGRAERAGGAGAGGREGHALAECAQTARAPCLHAGASQPCPASHPTHRRSIFWRSAGSCRRASPKSACRRGEARRGEAARQQAGARGQGRARRASKRGFRSAPTPCPAHSSARPAHQLGVCPRHIVVGGNHILKLEVTVDHHGPRLMKVLQRQRNVQAPAQRVRVAAEAGAAGVQGLRRRQRTRTPHRPAHAAPLGGPAPHLYSLRKGLTICRRTRSPRLPPAPAGRGAEVVRRSWHRCVAPPTACTPRRAPRPCLAAGRRSQYSCT